jgi:hypothetical protein
LRRLASALGCLLLAATLALSSVPAALAGDLDTATATGNNFVIDDFSATDIEVDAHSGPAGENPGGAASFVAGGILPIAGPVSCLEVSGNEAVLTIDGPFSEAPAYSAFLIRLVDNGGNGQDVFQYYPDDPEAPDTLDCREGSPAWFGGKLDGRAAVADIRPAPPVITDLAVVPKAFRASGKPTPLERRRGARIKVGLSADATVTFRVRRTPRGAGGKPPRHPRRFKRELEAGRNSFRFTGTIGAHTLRPGRYRLIARARDSIKQPSARVSTRFRIRP